MTKRKHTESPLDVDSYSQVRDLLPEIAEMKATNKELLEALQWLYAICLKDGLLPPTVSYMENARTAIAKATGNGGGG